MPSPAACKNKHCQAETTDYYPVYKGVLCSACWEREVREKHYDSQPMHFRVGPTRKSWKQFASASEEPMYSG